MHPGDYPEEVDSQPPSKSFLRALWFANYTWEQPPQLNFWRRYLFFPLGALLWSLLMVLVLPLALVPVFVLASFAVWDRLFRRHYLLLRRLPERWLSYCWFSLETLVLSLVRWVFVLLFAVAEALF